MSGEEYQLEESLGLFIRELKKKYKIVLITLQPIENALPLHVQEAMKMSPPNLYWLIRLHPRRLKNMALYKSILASTGVKNYEIEISSNILLYPLLSACVHHVTCWSSTCFESIALKIPTTIIHKSGLTLYKKYIDKGIFNYADNPESLLVSIDNGRGGDKNQEPTYIETDVKFAESALLTIIKNG